MRNRCLLCDRELSALAENYQAHPEADDCLVRFTDGYGVSVPPRVAHVIAEHVEAAEEADEAVNLEVFPPIDKILVEFFEAQGGLPRLGGVSTGRGWSSFALWERCPYAWKRRHMDQYRPAWFLESPSLAVGTLVHVFLALYYANMIGDSPYRKITPEAAHDALRRRGNPTFIAEGWRLFDAYRRYYANEEIEPLAVEFDLRDPRTYESCRFDLIAYFPTEAPNRPAGTYNLEHKTSGRFDQATLNAWPNDGEVLGQMALWGRLDLDKRFGKLQATIINLIGKQKVPQFHRTYVAPTTFAIESHLDDLARIAALMNLARTTGNYPRHRGNCVNRYGMCDLYDHCATGEP